MTLFDLDADATWDNSLLSTLVRHLLTVDTFEGYNVEGFDLGVRTKDGDFETAHRFHGARAHACVNECLFTPYCHGFVTWGDQCWFRGGAAGSAGASGELLAANRVPAEGYTLYVLYPTAFMWAAGALAIVCALVALTCCCVMVRRSQRACGA